MLDDHDAVEILIVVRDVLEIGFKGLFHDRRGLATGQGTVGTGGAGKEGCTDAEQEE
jgi:hypothetical protein